MRIQNLRVMSSNTRVMISDPRVTSSNPPVMSSNPPVTSSNPRVTSPDSRVTSSNPRITSSNLRVTSSNPSSRIITLNSLKSFSFPKIISSKLLDSLREKLVRSFSGDNLFFYVSTTPWLRLQQETE